MFGKKIQQSKELNLSWVRKYVNNNRKSIKRNSATDWRRVFDLAKEGKIEEIAESAPDIVVRHYSSIKRILQDNIRPPLRRGITVQVYWGNTGTGKHTERLKKLESLLILKDQLQSGGMVTEKKKMLSLMNSVEQSESNIFSDGWIGSQSSSKSKEAHPRCTQSNSGLRPTSTQENGTTTPTPLKNKGKRCRED